MQDRSIFLAFLTCWGLYLVAVYGYSLFRQASLIAATASHIVPTATAMMMIRIFIVGHGSTIAQFVAGSDKGRELWSLWFHLWPWLLLISFLSAMVLLTCTAVVICRSELRKYIPVTVGGALMSGFCFFTVAANFPDA